LWHRPTDDYGRAKEVKTGVREGAAQYYIPVRDIGETSRKRWVDYTGILVDPADDNCLWVYNQFADNHCNSDRSDCWTTTWAQYCIKPKPDKSTIMPKCFPKPIEGTTPPCRVFLFLPHSRKDARRIKNPKAKGNI
jgi:hypothetical protein